MHHQGTSSHPNVYEVDTVMPDGAVATEYVPCGGAFSLGNPEDKQAALDWIVKQTRR
jgi:hypothetical protein